MESLLAGRSLTASLSRTSVVVAALATAIAMMASVGIMVGSFRETVALWLDIQLRADLYVRPAVPSSAGDYPAARARGRRHPGVHAGGGRGGPLPRGPARTTAGERATLGAGDLDIVRRYGRLRFLPGEDRDAILRSLPGRDRAIVSEPFANQHHVRAGDRLTLPIGEHDVTLTVAGIYYEYSSSQGYVIVDRSTLLKYLPGQPATNAAIYLAPGADAASASEQSIAAARGRLRRGGGAQRGAAPQLRSRSSTAPSRSPRRSRPSRSWWPCWAPPIRCSPWCSTAAANWACCATWGHPAAQVRGMILTEAAFLGLLAILLGLALGLALSLLLIFVVNKQSFGWTIQFHPPRELLLGALFAVWCVTVLAGLYPARVASRLNPIDVIHEE